MSATTYLTITALCGIGILTALVLMIVSFIGMIVRWRTTKRRGHVLRLVFGIIVIPCLYGTQRMILWQVHLPSLARQQTERMRQDRAPEVARKSLVKLGDLAPDFSLTTADGDDFVLSDARGKVVLINFFATWCAPCQLELPHIDQIWRERGDEADFHILVIGYGESMESVQEFRAKHGFSFPVAADPERELFSLFASGSIPRTYVVSADGVVVYSEAGYYDDVIDQVNAVLDEQLAERSR